MTQMMRQPSGTTKQAPIGSGFDRASTAEQVIAGIDLRGKTVIVTGGYSGLGIETVRVLLDAGGRVIVPARDEERARAALKGLNAEVWPMDLLDPTSIDAFALRFIAENTPLDILINNAGIMALPELARDPRGHELQFATNHLGHFQLTVQLWPAQKAAKGARVISLASLGHRFSPVVFEDIDFRTREYTPFAAYGQSKTANVLFAVALDARGAADNIRAFAVHPGGILETNLARHLDPEMLKGIEAVDADGKMVIDADRGLKNIEMGAATQVWCATSPALAHKGGVYCEDCDISPVVNPADIGTDLGAMMHVAGVFPHAIDHEAAARLWLLSEKLTGVKI